MTLIDCHGSRGGEDPRGEPLSSEVAFDVLPLDEKRLAGVCEQLAHEALSSNGDQAKEAARALSRIDSPVAVSFLQKVLDANVFASFFVVPGLASINTPETTKILIEAFDKSAGFTRIRIKEALYQMKPQIDDPALRQKLDSILAWQPQIVE